MSSSLQKTNLLSLLPEESKVLLTHSGLDFVENEGIETIRNFALDVFYGRNFRNATEMVTRYRISTLNLGLLQFYIKGMNQWPNFLDELPYVAVKNLKEGGLSKGEKWLNQWVIGLTNKGSQNILRDDWDEAEKYADRYIQTCKEAAESAREDVGELISSIGLASEDKVHDLGWVGMVYLKNAIGSSTLTIRGSDKSTFGKLFEKLILGPLLHVLDFDYIKSGKDVGEQTGVFWLSSTAARESDATLIVESGEAIRFDIGFIGRGNPEIVLDKVTRFQNRIELGQEEFFLRTIVIADRLGKKSQVKKLALKSNGYVATMDTEYWPRDIANHLDEIYGFDHELVGASDEKAKSIIDRKTDSAPLRKYLRIATGKEDDSAPDANIQEELDI